MGNVESRPIHRPGKEGHHKTSRPLPPLPDDSEDEYDLDSPPPYPPPPPPEENGGKSKRISWRFRDTNLFGGLKRGSWALPPHHENDIYRFKDETINEKNISNTIATEDNNVVTVSVIGTPEKDDIIKTQWKPSSESTLNGSSKINSEDQSPQSSWGVKNMQLVLNSEMRGNDIDSNQTKHYPYPDVQHYSENERSSLPDLVAVKTRQPEVENDLKTGRLSYAFENKASVSVNKESYQSRRVEDIRIDYPEGKAKEVSNYNTLEFKKEASVQPLKVGVALESPNVELKYISSPKTKKNKLGSCFGKRKADDLSDDEERQASNISSIPQLSTSTESPNLNVEFEGESPKKTKKAKLGSCFGKSPTKYDIDQPISTSTPEPDTKMKLRESNLENDSVEHVEFITPKLEFKHSDQEDIKKNVKNPKKQSKSNLGSCFGKGKAESKVELKSHDLDIDVDKEIKVEDDVPSLKFTGTEVELEKGFIGIDRSPQRKKKTKLGSCFGSSSKDKTEIKTDEKQKNSNDVEFKIKTQSKDVEVTPQLNFDVNLENSENFPHNNISDEVDYKLNIPSGEINLKTKSKLEPVSVSISPLQYNNENMHGSPEMLDLSLEGPHVEFEVESPNINIDLESKIDKEIEVPIYSLKDPELDLNLKEDIKLEGKSADLDISFRLPETNYVLEGKSSVDIDSPRLEPETTVNIPNFNDSTTEVKGKIEVKSPHVKFPLPEDLKSSIDVDSPQMECQLQTKQSKITLPKGSVTPKKNKVGLGSCFGKSPKKNISLEGDVDVSESKISHNKDLTLEAEGYANIKPKETKGGLFSSCAGKNKKSNVDLNMSKPERQVSLDIPTSKIDVKTSEIRLDADINIPDIKDDVYVPVVSVSEPDIHVPKVDISLEGKSSNIQILPNYELKEDIDLPIKVSDIDSSSAQIDVGNFKIESPKIDANVESEIPKLPNIENEITLHNTIPNVEMKGKTPEISIEVKSPTLSPPEMQVEVSRDLPELKIETKDVDVEPKVKLGVPKSSKKKGGLGSCFGKKPKGEVVIDRPDVDISVKGPSVKNSIDIESPSIGDVSVPQAEVKMGAPKVSKKGGLGSCFGKEPKGKVDIDKPVVDVSLKGPPVEGSVDIDLHSLEGDVSVPQAEVEMGAPKISKKKGGLGSCFGKKEKGEVDIDKPVIDVSVKGPSAEGSVDIKSPALEGHVSVPEAEVKMGDPKISKKKGGLGSCFGKKPKGEVEIDKPIVDISVKGPLVEGSVDIESPALDVSVPEAEVKMGAPKISKKKGGLGSCFGKKTKGEVDIDKPVVDVSVKAPSVEGSVVIESPALEGDVSVPEAEVKMGVPKISKKKGGLGSCFGKKPKGEVDIDKPVVDVSVKGPSVEGSVDIESPSLEGDASVPEAEVKMGASKISKKKGGLGSCFGKKTKGEVDIDKPVVDVSVEGPSVEGSVDIESPALEGDVNIPEAEVKMSVPKISKKKGGLGSCFGKKNKGEVDINKPVVDVSVKGPSVEGSVDIESPSLEGDVSVPEAEVKMGAPKISKKAGLGSCFGKKTKGEVDIDKPIGDVSVKRPSVEGSFDIESPALEGDVSVPEAEVKMSAPKISKKKGGFGSCFGKKPKGEVDIDKPIGDVSVKGPSVEGSVDIESHLEGDVSVPEAEVKISAPKISKKKGGLGSCFGKKPKGEVNIDKPVVDVSVKGPSVEGSVDIESPALEGDVSVPEAEVKMGAPKISKKKGGLGSCFGKKTKGEVDIDNTIVDVSVKGPSVEGSDDIESPSLEGDVSVPEAEVKMSAPKISKKKGGLGSCFGKKTKGEVDIDKPIIDVSVTAPSVEGSVDIESPAFEGDVSVPEAEVKMGAPKISKKKGGLGSCFGKKAKGEVDIDKPIGDISVKGPSVEGSVDIESPLGVVSVPEAEVKMGAPKISKKKGGLGSCFGKKAKGDVDIDKPVVDVSVKGPSVEGSVDIKSPALEGDVSVPEAEVKVGAPKISKKKGGLGSCFGKKPKGKVDIDKPVVDVSVKGPSVEGSVDIESPALEGDVSVPEAEVKMGAPKISKKKGGLGSCFGKKTKGEVDIDNTIVDVSVKGPSVEGSVDIESPSLEGDVSVPEAEVKMSAPKISKKKGGLGSCFGKKPKGEVDIDKPIIDVSVTAPSVEGSVDIKSPVLEDVSVPEAEVKMGAPKISKKKGGLGSCFGKKPKGEVDIDKPVVDVSVKGPSVEGSVDIESPSLEGDGKVPEAEVKMSAPKISRKKGGLGSCFGKKPKSEVDIDKPVVDVSVTASSVEGSVDIESPSLEGDVIVPEAEVKMSAPKISKKKGGLGSCFGRKPKGEVDIDKPIIDVSVTAPSVEGSVDIKSPALEDVSVPEAEVKMGAPKISKKKGGLGSCFGKKPKGEVDIDKPVVDVSVKGPSVEGSVDIESPALEGDVSVPEAEVKMVAPKISKKGGLGSCFGKKPKGEVDIDKPIVDVSVKGPSVEGSVDIESPSLEGDVSVPEAEVKMGAPKISKKKGGLGSCFGKKPKGEVDIDKPVIDVSVKGPSVEGSVDIESPSLEDVGVPEAEVKMGAPKISKKKGVLGSCFGKKPRGEMDIDKPVVDVSIKGPSVEGSVDIKDFSVPQAEVKMGAPNVSKKRGGLGSCFGKTSKGEVDIDRPDVDVSAKGLTVEGSGDIESPSVEGDFSVPQAEIKMVAPKVSTKKSGLGSCFGKKAKGEVDIDKPVAGVCVGKPSIEGSVNIESPSLEGDVSISQPEIKLDAPKASKKKVGLGSCFGKKPKGEVDIDKPVVDVNVKGPSVEGSVDIDSASLDVSVPQAKVKIDDPKVSKKMGGLGSCFGRKPKVDVDIDKPDVDVSAKGPSIEASIDIESHSIEDVSVSQAEVRMGAPKVSKKRGGLGSCFGMKPKGEVDIDRPDVDVSAKGPSLAGSVDIESPSLEGDVDVPQAEVKVDVSKLPKKKSSSVSCFGKKPKGEVKVDRPDIDVSIKGPLVEGSVDESPSIGDVNVSQSVKVGAPKVSKKKGSLGSCFGKKPKGEINIDKPNVVVDEKLDSDPKLKAEIKTEGSMPKKSVSFKKKNIGLGSCFGKSPKSKISLEGDVDLHMSKPERQISVDIPSRNIDIKTSELSLKSDIDVPDIKDNVEVPVVCVKGPDFDIPKLDVCLEGKSSNIPSVPETCFELESPNLELKDVDLLVMLPDIINSSTQFDVGNIEIESPNFDINVESDIPNVPDIENEINLDTNIPNVKIKVETQDGSIGEVEPPTFSPHEIQIDISQDLPELKMESSNVDIKAKNIRENKKIKFNSCFGKKKTDIKCDVYVPSVKDNVKIEAPDVSESLEVGAKAEIDESNFKPNASKSKFSCFGKKQKSKINIEPAVEVSVKGPSVEGSINVEKSALEGDVSVPEAEVKMNAPKISKKGGLGSCFGKKTKGKDNIEKPVVDVSARGPSTEGCVDIESPSIEGDVSGPQAEVKMVVPKVSKKKDGLGSCFGKKPKGEVDIYKPDVDGVKGPSIEGSVDIQSPSVEGDVKVSQPELKLNVKNAPKKEGGLGSCFGKKPKSEVDIDKPAVDVSVKGPLVEGSINIESPSLEGDVSVSQPELKLDAPKASKNKVGLGSCFGKKPKGEVDIDKPVVDVNVKGPSVEGSVDIDPASLDVSVPQAKVKIDDPKVSKKMGGLGSCFGKKPKGEVDIDKPDVDVNVKGPSVEGSADIESPFNVNVSQPELKLDAKNASKKKGSLGSCFGKKPKGEVDIDKLDVDVIAKGPAVEGSVDIESLALEGDINVPQAEVKMAAPKVSMKKGGLGSCFGKKPKCEVDIDKPDVDVSVKGHSVEGSVDIESTTFDVNVPQPELKLDAKNTSKKKSGLGSCFGKKPKSEVDIDKPNVDVSVKGLSVEGEVDIESPSLEAVVSVPPAEVKLGAPKTPKKKVGLGSCFGKKPKNEVDIDKPDVDVSDKPSVEGSVDIEISSIEGNISVPQAEVKLGAAKSPKKKGGLGSCFGKKPKEEANVDKPDVDVSIKRSSVEGFVDIESPSIEGDVNVPHAEVKLNASKPKKKGGLGSCFGNKSKGDVAVDRPNVNVSVKGPSVEGSVDIETPSLEGDVNVPQPEPKLDAKNAQKKGTLGSCFGKKPKGEVDIDRPDVDISVKRPAVEGSVDIESSSIEGDVSVPQTEFKLDAPKASKKKGSLGSCFGKKPKNEFDIDRSTDNVFIKVPSVEGSVYIGSPFLEGDVSVPQSPKKKGDADIDLDSSFPDRNLPVDILFRKMEVSRPEVIVDCDFDIKGDIGVLDSNENSAVPVVYLNDPDINVPKLDLSLEGKSTIIPILPETNFELESLNFESKEDIDFSIKLPDIATSSAQFDVGNIEFKSSNFDATIDSDIITPIDVGNIEIESDNFNVNIDSDTGTQFDVGNVEIEPPHFNANIDSDISKLPDIEKEITLETNISNVEMKVDIPEVCLGEVKSPILSPPELQLEVSRDLPELKIESKDVDIKAPKVKGKNKIKVNPCFGKGKTDIKGEVYSPSNKVQVNFESPNVPESSDGELNVSSEKVKLEFPNSFKKMGDIGSYFKKKQKEDLGINNPSAAVDVKSPSVEGSIVIESPLKEDINVLHLDTKPVSKSPEKKAGIGSCFGKKQKAEIKFDDPTVDINVEEPSAEGSISLKVPEYESDMKVTSPRGELESETKKPKSKFGSCFGRKAEFEVNVPSKKLDGETAIKLSNDVNAIDDSIESNVQSKNSNGSPNARKDLNFKLGSWFGKSKDKSKNITSPDIEISGPSNTSNGSVEFDSIKLENGDIKNMTEEENVDVKFNFDPHFNINFNENFPIEAEIKTNLPNPVLDDNFHSADLKSSVPLNILKNSDSVVSPAIEINQEENILNFGDSSLECENSHFYENLKGFIINGECAVPKNITSTEFYSNVQIKDTSTSTGRHDPDVLVNIPHVEGKRDIPNTDLAVNAELRCLPDISRDVPISANLPDIDNINISNLPQNAQIKSDINLSSPEFNLKLKEPSNLQTEDPSLSYEMINNVELPEKNEDKPSHIYENVDINDSTEFSGNLDKDSISFPAFQFEASVAPEPPKRWYGIDSVNNETDPNETLSTPFESDYRMESNHIPSEVLSDFQSLQFVKQMVHDESLPTTDDNEIIEGKLGPICISSPPKLISSSSHPDTVDLLMKKLEDFDKENYNSQPVVKRTIKVKTFKINEESNEPEEIMEEFEAEGDEAAFDTTKLLKEKLNNLQADGFESQPIIKRSIKIKTYKPIEGSSEPEEIIEEYEDESQRPFDDSEYLRNMLADLGVDQRNVGELTFKDHEDSEKVKQASKLLIKKLADIDPDSSRPAIKRTVTVKTYSTKDGDDEDTLVEEYEESQDTTLERSEATQFLLKRIADFDGQGISGEPFVKRTVKVKTYKTKEGSDDSETVDEFEHSSTDMSLSDILYDKYPELKDTKFESDEIFKSLTKPLSENIISNETERQIGGSSELQGSIHISPFGTAEGKPHSLSSHTAIVTTEEESDAPLHLLFGTRKSHPDEGTPLEDQGSGKGEKQDRPKGGRFDKLFDSATQPVRKTYNYKPSRRSSLKNFETQNDTKASNEVEPVSQTPFGDSSSRSVSSVVDANPKLAASGVDPNLKVASNTQPPSVLDPILTPTSPPVVDQKFKSASQVVNTSTKPPRPRLGVVGSKTKSLDFGVGYHVDKPKDVFNKPFDSQLVEKCEPISDIVLRTDSISIPVNQTLPLDSGSQQPGEETTHISKENVHFIPISSKYTTEVETKSLKLDPPLYCEATHQTSKPLAKQQCSESPSVEESRPTSSESQSETKISQENKDSSSLSQDEIVRQKDNRKLASFRTTKGITEGDQKHSEVSSEKPAEVTAQKERKGENDTPHIVSSPVNGSAAPKAATNRMQPQVRVLTLNHEDNLQSTLFRLQKGYVLQFRPGPSLFGKTVNVFTNHPDTPSEPFQRTQYRRLPWHCDSTNRGDDTALYVEVNILTAGSFRFYFTYDDNEDLESSAGSGYFIVDPVLSYANGNPDDTLPLDCIQCQTVMAKCLGLFEEWHSRLLVTKESGYNMIHFTPIQKLGCSRSGYSLADQLHLNPEFSSPKKEYGMNDVEELVKKMRTEWKVLSLTDIVLNHTANESPWLKVHPESTYNMGTAPHLRPAYVIDRALYHFTLEVADGKWEGKGVPKKLDQECHLEAIRQILFDVLSKPHVEEFYFIDVDKMSKEFDKIIQSSTGPKSTDSRDKRLKSIKIIQDPSYRRNSGSVDLDLSVSLFDITWWGTDAEGDRKKRSVAEFRGYLEYLNRLKKEEIDVHLRQAVNCIIGTVSYERIQKDGPKLPEVSKKYPLTPPYFTHYGPDTTLEEEEKLSLGTQGCFLMAHNGWVMSHDPLINFALEDSNVYLRRELIAWGDSVKLRYGDKPEDSPYLWEHMRKYVEETATIFDGIRLDNCHSTPIHVAEYLLDCARRVRPDLYVIAELFTNSDLTDNIFVNRLGINSLIREAMSAPNSHEEGRLVHRYGGEPVGAFILPPVRPLTPSIAHAIFLDLTHDNKSPCEVRTGWDMLPSTALVNMACCASGSNRGYDEIVPHHIHVVDEERKYTSWSEGSDLKSGEVNSESGIIKAKKVINDLHFYLGKNGFNEVFVDQVTEHVVTVTRHNPVTHESVVLVAYTSFKPPTQIGSPYVRPLKVQGKFEEILFECSLKSKDKSDEDKIIPGIHTKDPNFINGVNDFILEVRSSLQPSASSLVRQVSKHGADTTIFEYTANFRPGSVIVFKLRLLPLAQEAVNKIRTILNDFSFKNRISEISNQNRELEEIIRQLSLSDLNRVLYRCDQEEGDEKRGWGVYNIPNFAPFVYCGLQGLISSLCEIRMNNDLGHPICRNLRDGDWLPNYVFGRLKLESSSERLGKWLEDVFEYLHAVPRYLIPAYFDAIIAAVYYALINHAWLLMGGFVVEGSDFVKALALCSVQFSGVVKSALLPPLSPNLTSPQPPTHKDKYGRTFEASVTLSAGLPHFSTGYMRNWGRDTFIALPGNLLITGRYQEARWIILAFAATLRHGLIPNLLDGGQKARFNCRDAVWFWLYSIQQYVIKVPNGHEIFKDKVSRIFPKDDSSPQPPGEFEHFLEDVIQEALERHFQGVKFRERNAGHQIDSQMTDAGFNNEIGIDKDTGFPFGGNIHNCGTWMDKMGSSEKAGNKGIPATPRDGSAVEIVGLCKAAVRFLADMHKQGKYPYSGVVAKDDSGNHINWSFTFWETMIGDNFEKYFWVNDTPDPQNEPRQDLINRRGIYKDSIRASQPWANFQLRCNFPIAIAVAPEMFTPEKAWKALDNVEKILLGPLGIKTLDSSDWNYRGDYDNANDSSDGSVAKGFNYHQGPEWVWPVGFFMRARLAIAARLGPQQLTQSTSHIKALLAVHLTQLMRSPWRSLPELTNSNGSHCRDSNPAQSWSTGCLLEVLYEMDQLEVDQS